MEGKLFENAGRGCHGEKQSWLPSVCVGAAWVSAWLNAGGTDVKGDWQEQLDQDVAPWLTGRQPVGLRADSAYYCQDLVSYCRRKGWDYSVSVTDPRKKAPILRLAAARGLREGGAPGRGGEGAGARGGVPAGPGAGGAGVHGDPVRRGRGAAAAGAGMHGDSGEPRPAATGGAGAAAPRPAGAGACVPGTVDRPRFASSAVPLARGASGFYLGAQIAQLRRRLQYQGLPSAARQHRLRPLIRYFVGSVGRLTHSARRRLCSRGNLRLDGLLPAASRARAGAARPGPPAGDRRGARATEPPLKPYGPATPISGNYPGI